MGCKGTALVLKMLAKLFGVKNMCLQYTEKACLMDTVEETPKYVRPR